MLINVRSNLSLSFYPNSFSIKLLITCIFIFCTIGRSKMFVRRESFSVQITFWWSSMIVKTLLFLRFFRTKSKEFLLNGRKVFNSGIRPLFYSLQFWSFHTPSCRLHFPNKIIPLKYCFQCYSINYRSCIVHSIILKEMSNLFDLFCPTLRFGELNYSNSN